MYKVYEHNNNQWVELANDFELEYKAWKFIADRCTITGKPFDNFKVEKVGEESVQDRS